MTQQVSNAALTFAFGFAMAVLLSTPVVADDLPGDANLDGVVDLEDFIIWNDNRFGPGEFSLGDFNGDGSVDVTDFNIWNENRTPEGGNPLVVPEPAGAIMMVFTGLAICWSARRLHVGR